MKDFGRTCGLNPPLVPPKGHKKVFGQNLSYTPKDHFETRFKYLNTVEMLNNKLNKTPDHRLVILHYLTSAFIFLLVSGAGLFFPRAFMGHYFSPELLAITHLAVFGWITMIIFGALYQLLPVISGNSLYSERLGYLTYALLLGGIPLLVMDFYSFDLSGLVHWGGPLILIAVGCFAVNLFKTLAGKPPSLEKDFIGTSGVWLLVTVLLGLLFALNLRYAFLPREHLSYLKLHAHVGAVGWFLSLIMGVGARLIPMFSLAHNLSLKPLKWAYWLLQAGLVAMIIQRMLGLDELGIFSWAGIAGAIVSYLTYIRFAYRKRMRRKHDPGMKTTFFAFLLLLFPVILGSIISWYQAGNLGPEWGIIYGILFVMGFIGFLIIGQTFKTLPFIIWMAYLQPFAGKEGIPMPQDLVSNKLLNATLLIFFLGVLSLLSGIALQLPTVIQVAGIFLFIGVTFYNIGIYNALFLALKTQKTLSYGKASTA